VFEKFKLKSAAQHRVKMRSGNNFFWIQIRGVMLPKAKESYALTIPILSKNDAYKSSDT
jgi:hypothetical protein